MNGRFSVSNAGLSFHDDPAIILDDGQGTRGRIFQCVQPFRFLCYSKLVDTLLSIKIEKLRTFLRNSPAANLVEEKIEKTAISIRAVLTNYVKAIRYLQGIEHNGESFTIRDWMRGVREDQKNGWLFISSNADTHASLKPVISMWLSIAIRGLLAMGENRNRRVWFFCDELSPDCRYQ